MSATPTDKAAAEAAAKAELAKKRKEEQAKRDELYRDVPPGIGEIEAKTKKPLNLYAAILKAQAEFETVRKNGENPHFRSKYATLDEIWETIKKPFNKAGLIAFCTIDTTPDGGKELTTHVAEVKSGEEISCSFPILSTANTPQVVGSYMTYARRYTLSALLEIVTGDGLDDDGEAATTHGASAQPKNPKADKAADALGL